MSNVDPPSPGYSDGMNRGPPERAGKRMGERGPGFLEYLLLAILACLVVFSFWAALGGGPAEVWAVLRRTVLDWLGKAGVVRP